MLPDGEGEHPDPYQAVYFNMFFQGICNLIPWNILVYANRYFETRLSHVPEASNFIYYFTLIFMAMKFIFLISGISVSHKVNPDAQITWSIVGNTIVFACIGVVCGFDLLDPRPLYYILLMLVLLASLFSAFVEAGFLAILTYFPAKYTQSYLVGHGFAGVAGALLHIASTVNTDSAISQSFAELFFGIATFFILFSVGMFHFMKTLGMFQYFYKKGRSVVEAKEEAEKLAKATGIQPSGHSSLLEVLREIKDLFSTVLILTWSNLLISPMMILMTESVSMSHDNRDLFHVIAFLISSLFDLFGKAIPAFSKLTDKRIPFIALAGARVLLIPILLLGNVKMKNFTLPFSPLYRSDVVFMTIVALKALTGGYLGTLCMMWSPYRVKPVDRAKAVTIMVYAIGTGLLLGAISALGVRKVLEVLSVANQ